MAEEARAVHLDRLGVVPEPEGDLRATVFVSALPDTARQRLEGDDRFTLVEDRDQLGDCDVALVSTRTPRTQLSGLVTAIADGCPGPLVALVHTGGEAAAVELVRRGAVAVLGEGDELVLAAVLTGDEPGSGLLEAYDRSQVGAAGGSDGRGIDPVTGLPDGTALKARTEELLHDGDTPRVALVRLLHLPRAPRELSHEGVAAVRRRIATQFLHLVQQLDAQLYTTGVADFAILGTGLSPSDADELALGMQELATAFVPSGVQPLALAFGHAGPEVATEAALLVELAERALDVAAHDREGGIVSAEMLALGMAPATELQSSMELLANLERRTHRPDGHGERVARMASALATELGYEGQTQVRVRLAAHLHEIGRAGLPAAVLADPATLTGELLATHRTHPVRGAAYLRPVAGDEVADAVLAHAEHWDGDGFPDALRRVEIPLTARLVAAAVEMVEALGDARDGAGGIAAPRAAERLRSLAGTRLDPELAEAAAGLVLRGVGVGLFALAS